MAFSSESKLAQELKDLCEPYHDKWKEKNPKETATILHQLGILYKDKCYDEKEESLQKKIAFIQSAALLNCALVRQPPDIENIKSDLHPVTKV